MRERLKLPSKWDGNVWYYRNLGRIHAMHHHAELEFNLVTRGSGVYLLANRKYQIRRGDLLWLFPAQEHVLIEQTLDFEMWIGVFKPGAVRRIAGDADAGVLRKSNPAVEYCRRLRHEKLAWLDKLLAEIAASREQSALFNVGLAYALLSTWRHFQQAADVPVRDVHPAVEKAARLIRDETEPMKLNELSSRCGLSPSRLSRLFKEQTGTALVDFRNRQRIERFFTLYDAGHPRTLLDVALKAGFGSYPQFHRIFKRMTGRSPGSFRKTGVVT